MAPSSSSPRGGFNMGCLLAVILVIVAAGVGVFFLGKASMDVIAEQVGEAVKDNPVILEHIGEIQEIELNFGASSDTLKDEMFTFGVRGTKGRGELVVRIDVDESKAKTADGKPPFEVLSGTLEMSTGETYDILPAPAPAPDSAAPATTDER